MSIDQQQHVALPKLFGAPAYARPPMPVEPGPRPFDPDELPIEASMSEDERQLISSLPARAYAPEGSPADAVPAPAPGSGLRPRAMHLKAIAGRLLGGDRASD